jgi:hypothetical protein
LLALAGVDSIGLRLFLNQAITGELRALAGYGQESGPSRGT